ncbi:MAG: NAD(+) synthase [Candidatus Omnitrophica bacterium]|nr:NAD(+) synthase [Candidatus Omnitrophota bacterium]
MKLSDEIAAWIKKQVKNAGKKGIVLGLSGGIDSACVAALSKLALGDNVLGLILPCKSNSLDAELALKTAKQFNIKTKAVTLDTLYEEVVKIDPEAKDLAKANLKPRLRMLALYYYANTLDYLVAGTGNKSELLIGYFTKYGDGGSDILPIGGLLKTEVKKLAAELRVPSEIIKRPPSAGLWEGQTDEGEIGVTYEELDKAIAAIEEKKIKDIDKATLSKVKKMMENSAHKRVCAPIFRRNNEGLR